MNTGHAIELESVRHAINAIDLGPIRYKLMDRKDGEGWPRQLVDDVEVWYRRFLFLNAKMRGSEVSIVPNKLIDTFWHYHILDTQKYADDCSVMFGYFLHHFPYFGMRGDEDAANLSSSFESTLQIFEAEFGESPRAIGSDSSSMQSTWREDDFSDQPLVTTEAHCATACTTPCDGVTDGSLAVRPSA